MGYDVSVCAAFSVMLSEHASKLGGVYEEFIKKLGEPMTDKTEEAQEVWGDEKRERVAEEYTPKFIEAFKRIGILVPEPETMLFYTGTDDERPGRTDTDSEEWILGFGLLTQPWNYPHIHNSFKKVAQWYTWVIGG